MNNKLNFLAAASYQNLKIKKKIDCIRIQDRYPLNRTHPPKGVEFSKSYGEAVAVSVGVVDVIVKVTEMETVGDGVSVGVSDGASVGVSVGVDVAVAVGVAGGVDVAVADAVAV